MANAPLAYDIAVKAAVDAVATLLNSGSSRCTPALSRRLTGP